MRKMFILTVIMLLASNTFAANKLSTGRLTIIALPATEWGFLTERQFDSTFGSKIFLKNSAGKLFFVGSLNQRDGDTITYRLIPGHYAVYASNLSFSLKNSTLSKKPTINTIAKIDIDITPNEASNLSLNMAWHRHRLYFKQINTEKTKSLINKLAQALKSNMNPNIVDIDFDKPPTVYYSSDEKLLIRNIDNTHALADFQYASCQLYPSNHEREKSINCVYPYLNATDFNNALYPVASARNCPSNVNVSDNVEIYGHPPVTCTIYMPHTNQNKTNTK